VIRRRPWERKTECDVHGAAERRNFDRRHANIVVGRDYHIELAAHGAHEYRVGGKRSVDSGSARRGRENVRVLIAESAAIAGVWIERAQRDARLGDVKPVAQPGTRDARRFADRLGIQRPNHLAQGNVCRRQNYAELVRSQHHCDARAR